MTIYIITAMSIALIVACYVWYKVQIYEADKKYNAGIKCWLLTKGDHINTYIDQRARQVKKQNTLIDVKDFMEFINDIQKNINYELAYKKYKEENDGTKD